MYRGLVFTSFTTFVVPVHATNTPAVERMADI